MGSVVLDTALGLVFVFLAASLVCTGVVEWISKLTNKRGEYLLRGLREMLDIPPSTPAVGPEENGARRSPSDVPAPATGLLRSTDMRGELNRLSTTGAALAGSLDGQTQGSYPRDVWLADLVLAHPLVASLHRPDRPGSAGTHHGVRRSTDGMHLASYLSARTFARAVIDLFVPDADGQTSVARMRARVEKLDPGVPGRAALLALLRDAADDLDVFRGELEQWYDEQMARVSGWYKRWAQWRLFIAGAVLAVVANVDTIGVAQTLYRDAPVRNAVVAAAQGAHNCLELSGEEREACFDRQEQVLGGLPLPIGWDFDRAAEACPEDLGVDDCGRSVGLWVQFGWRTLVEAGLLAVVLHLLGWLLTAAAVSFGAPFWFDALSKLGSLRTAGRRPGEPRFDTATSAR